jgi:hypothetical protein
MSVEGDATHDTPESPSSRTLKRARDADTKRRQGAAPRTSGRVQLAIAERSSYS